MDDLELREAVAREVFGLPKVHETGVLCRQLFWSDSSPPHPIPPYESTYEGMGLVIDAMERKGWECAIEFAHSMAFVAFARCGHKPWEYIEREEALTAPRAVALAALAAVRSEK